MMLNLVEIKNPNLFPNTRVEILPRNVTVNKDLLAFDSRLDGLLAAHDLKRARLLQLFPSWNLTLESVQNVSSVLSNERLETLCTYFGVNREWLEAGEGAVFCCQPYAPESFLKVLEDKGWLGAELRMTILAEDFDPRYQLGRYHILFSRQQGAVAGKSFYVHYLCGRDWKYDHPPCCIETKALARWYYMHHEGEPISILPINMKQYEAIFRGEAFLGNYFSPSWGPHFFDERVLDESESRIAIETEDIPEVLEYMNQNLGPWLSDSPRVLRAG